MEQARTCWSFFAWGFSPERLQGIDLLSARAEQARRVLPSSVRISSGDAAAPDFLVPAGSQDVVYQSTVFSSLLDGSFQHILADAMWRWVRPGGGVCWSDYRGQSPQP